MKNEITGNFGGESEPLTIGKPSSGTLTGNF